MLRGHRGWLGLLPAWRNDAVRSARVWPLPLDVPL